MFNPTNIKLFPAEIVFSFFSQKKKIIFLCQTFRFRIWSISRSHFLEQ